MSKVCDVVIVGAGIAGSALACALMADERAEFKHLNVVLIEACELPDNEPPASGGLESFDLRACALSTASCDFLSSVDVWQELVDKRVCPFRRMRVWDATGTGSIGFDATEVGLEQLGYIVENRLLTASMIKSARRHERLRIIGGQAVAKISLPDAEQGVLGCVELDNGEQFHCDLIVAADGANSQLRKCRQLPTKTWDYQQDAIVCNVETELPHQATAWQCFTIDGPLAFLPLVDGGASKVAGVENAFDAGESRLCSIVWSQTRRRADALMAMNDEAFSLALATALENKLGKIITLSVRRKFKLQQNHAKTYVEPGFALIADAAHTVHPLAGQGINLGLADVRALIEVMASAMHAGASPGAMTYLQRYQRQRKTDNLSMMAVIEAFKQTYRPLPLSMLLARNRAMDFVDRQHWLKNKILRYAMDIN